MTNNPEIPLSELKAREGIIFIGGPKVPMLEIKAAGKAQAKRMPEPGDVYHQDDCAPVFIIDECAPGVWDAVMMVPDVWHLVRLHSLTGIFLGNALKCVKLCADLGGDPANEIENLQTIRGYFVEAQDSLLIDDSNCSSKEWMERVRRRIAELLEKEAWWRSLVFATGVPLVEKENFESPVDDGTLTRNSHRKIVELTVAERRLAGLMEALEKEISSIRKNINLGVWRKDVLYGMGECVKSFKRILADHAAPEQVADAGEPTVTAPSQPPSPEPAPSDRQG